MAGADAPAPWPVAAVELTRGVVFIELLPRQPQLLIGQSHKSHHIGFKTSGGKSLLKLSHNLTYGALTIAA